MRTALILLLLVTTAAKAEDMPSGATTVYTGAADVPGYRAMYFRDSGGIHWRWLMRESDGVMETKTSYSSLISFRNALLAIDDRQGIMGAVLWKKDTDGDGYSDMLEYLTNGDPYGQDVYPTEPRILYFDGGQHFESLLPLQDMNSGGSGTGNGAESDNLENLLTNLLYVMSFLCGLQLWRLTVLSMSRRNLL